MAIISITCVKLTIIFIEKNIFLVLAMEQINDERKTITKI